MTLRDVTVENGSDTENKKDKSIGSHQDDSDSNLLTISSSAKFEEDSGLVDALAVAVSCMNITETKRIRLCIPPTSISHDCSSNIKPNLCTAF